MSEQQSFVVGEEPATIESRPELTPSSSKPSDITNSSNGSIGVATSPTTAGVAAESVQDHLKFARAFRYGRMFATPATPPKTDEPSDESFGIGVQSDPNAKADVKEIMKALSDLGLAMHKKGPEFDPEAPPDADQIIPAGYTYLGQFITHDITFDKTGSIADGELTSMQIRRGRTPSLELDSLYGMGPLAVSSRHLYEDDRLRFRIGKTTKTLLGNALEELPNDLPRDSSDPANPRKAKIADPRNDRNLALAQTHLAFLKFHNAVIHHLAKQGQFLGKELFAEARKIVIQHYQSIILDDYLPRIIDPSVLKSARKAVLSNDAKNCMTSSGGDLFLPIEFAFAAFRFGHSMVRDQYEWNRVFHSPDVTNRGAARLHHLFTFTGQSGNMQGAVTLPTNWVIDWTRFYDFKSVAGVVTAKEFNLARKIGPSLSLGMKGVPSFPDGFPIESRSIAVLDLLAGLKEGLPLGQEVAEMMKKRFKVTPLKADEIANGPHEDINKILRDNRLHEKTPLWFYILREAECQKNGRCLGQVGSRIVAETIMRVIHASEYSILKENEWKPQLKSMNPDHFEMVDLLVFVNDLNPLGI
jgi:hypothetical protein